MQRMYATRTSSWCSYLRTGRYSLHHRILIIPTARQRIHVPSGRKHAARRPTSWPSTSRISPSRTSRSREKKSTLIQDSHSDKDLQPPGAIENTSKSPIRRFNYSFTSGGLLALGDVPCRLPSDERRSAQTPASQKLRANAVHAYAARRRDESRKVLQILRQKATSGHVLHAHGCRPGSIREAAPH